MATPAEIAVLRGLAVLIQHDPTPCAFGTVSFNAVFIQDPERLAMLPGGYDERAGGVVVARVDAFTGGNLPTNRDFVTVNGARLKVMSALVNGAFVALTLHRHS